jgi:hypothetical protein
LRKIVHNFYLTEKQRPPLKAIHSKMWESTGYGGVYPHWGWCWEKWDMGKFNSLNRCALWILTLWQDSLYILNLSYMLPLNIYALILEHFIL